jgi:hypothetical protein
MGLNLKGTVELDGAGFERGLHRAGEKAKEFSTDLIKNAAVAAFGIYGVEEAIHKTVETATELVNESKRLDVTVEQLQLLRQAAKDGGTEMGALASAFEKLDLARAKALQGDKAALKAFQNLGVSNDALKNQTAATIFTTTLSQSVKSRSVEDLGPALREILGKSFGELIPVLKTDFDELGNSMKKLGGFMDADTAVKLKVMGDKFDLIKNILVIGLGPVLVKFGDALVGLTGILKQIKAGGSAAADKVGWAKTFLSFQKEIGDSVIDFIPKWLGGEHVQNLSDAYFKLLGVTPNSATNTVLTAGQAAQSTADEWQKFVAKMNKDLQAEIDALKNPKPRRTAGDDPLNPKSAHLRNIASDALVRVGNFLGANGNTISRVDQRKIDLLAQIARSNSQILTQMARQSISSMFFGIGVPV